MRSVRILDLSVIMATCFTVIGAAQEPSKGDATVGQYRLALPATWHPLKQDAKKAPILAIRKNKDGTKQIGEILASPLTGSVEKETSELIESVKKSPAVLSLDESGEFVTKDGVKGKKIALTLKIRDVNYGKPLAFYSIYLPQADGSCVTVKLRCGSADFAALRGEFDGIISGSEEGAVRRTASRQSLLPVLDRPRQPAGEPAVDVENLPRHERRRRRRQEDRGADHVLRFAEAFQRAVRLVPRLHVRFRPQLLRQVGADEAGGDGVHADAARAPFQGERLRHVAQARLAHRVGEHALERAIVVQRHDVDLAAPAARWSMCLPTAIDSRNGPFRLMSRMKS